MLQTFPAIRAGDLDITFTELTVGQALSLAKYQGKLEQQLSAFLCYVLDDKTAPYEMAIQQRYYCLLQYLSAQTNNDLSSSVNIAEYLVQDAKAWQSSVTIDDLSFRQLNGYEIEALEQIADGLDDWLFGAIALQITSADLPYIQPLNDRRMAANIIKSRHDLLMKLGQEKIDEIYAKYTLAEEQLASLLYTGFDSNGVVIYEVNGGADSVPARFQCDAAIFGITKRIFSALVERSPENPE